MDNSGLHKATGIEKKCSELFKLCGAEICIIIFSPAGKAFSFSHPSVDSIADRFLRGSYCKEKHKGGFNKAIVDDLEELDLSELKEYEQALLKLSSSIKDRSNQLLLEAGSQTDGATGVMPGTNAYHPIQGGFGFHRGLTNFVN